MSPPTALTRAQNWLRTATVEGLTEYIKLTGAKAGLNTDDVMIEMASAKLRRLSQTQTPSASVKKQAVQATAPPPRVFPFAHPYFWGGFFYTGM